jgi:hypothetical protein
MKDLNCPYCGEGLDVNHDDGFGYDEDAKNEMGCDKCGAYFVFRVIITYDYIPEKADCLNDGNHDFKPTVTYPKECTRMECTMCDKTRELTDEEFVEIVGCTKENSKLFN